MKKNMVETILKGSFKQTFVYTNVVPLLRHFRKCINDLVTKHFSGRLGLNQQQIVTSPIVKIKPDKQQNDLSSVHQI
jgi:hypothetical protein